MKTDHPRYTFNEWMGTARSEDDRSPFMWAPATLLKGSFPRHREEHAWEGRSTVIPALLTDFTQCSSIPVRFHAVRSYLDPIMSPVPILAFMFQNMYDHVVYF